MDSSARVPPLDELLSHQSWVRELARSLVGDAAAAEDLAQDTFAAALQSPPDTVESPRGWLATVLRKRWRERARGEKARTERELSRPADREVPTGDELLERVEQQRLLAEALAALREPLRTTVLLRYYEGLNAREIADRLGESPAAIRKRLERGLAALREDLDRRVQGGREAWLSALAPLAAPGGLGSLPVGAVLTGTTGALGGALIMKKTLVLVAALVLAGGALIVLDGFEPEPVELVGSASASGVGATPEAPAELANEARSPAAPSAPAGRETLEPSVALTDAARLTGRVAWPDERPEPDGTLEVFALADAIEYPEFVRAVDEGAGAGAIASTTVDLDGGFEFALPPELERVHLMVRGRYLYLEETVEVDLGAAPVVVLAPTCGAWVRGRVLPPPNALDADLAGVRVHLWADAIFGTGALQRRRYTAETDADGSFAMRAVTPRPNATLLALPGRFAATLLPLESIAACSDVRVDVSLHTGGTVSGRVKDAEGRTLAGANVVAILRGRYFGFDDHVAGEAATGEEGEFELSSLPPGEVYLKASLDGFLDSEKLKLHVVDRATADDVEIVLTDGKSIAGRLVHDDGSPAEGVRVDVAFDPSFQVGPSAFNRLRGAEGDAVTDAGGAFRVRGLGSGPFVVEAARVHGDEELTARADGVVPGGDALELVLRPGLAIEGHVETDEGEPVREFSVRVVRVSEGAVGAFATHEESEAFTADDGAFRFSGLIAGTWRVEVASLEFADPEPQVVTLPGARPLRFVVTPPATVEGVVLGPDDRPVAEATVQVDVGKSYWQERFSGAENPFRTTTDGRGRFTLTGVRSGETALRASAEGYARSGREPLTLRPGDEVEGVVLRLRQGGRVTGEVFEEGEPAPGRIISLIQWGRETFDTRMERSDEAGFFAFDNVEAGDWMVVSMNLDRDWSEGDDGSAAAQRMAAMKSASVSVEEGGEEHVVLGSEPRSAVELSGRITRGGEPYGDAMVFAMPVGEGAESQSSMSGVGADGRFGLTLDGGGLYQFSFSRMRDRAGDISALAFLREIPDEREAWIELEVPGGGVAGRVVDESGTTLSGVSVMLIPGNDATSEQIFSGRYEATTTDGSGGFEIADLLPGSYRLTAIPPAGLSTVVRDDVVIGEDQWIRDLELVARRPGTLELLVVDEFARPVEGAAIFVRDEGGNVVDVISEVSTDADGRARYEDLAPGDYTLLVRGEEYASSEELPVTVESGAVTEVEHLVEIGGTLILSAKEEGAVVPAAFQVLDEDGREVANLFQTMLEAQDYAVSGFRGARRVGPLAPGRYRVVAVTPDGATDRRSVTVKAGTERKLTLRPRR